MKITKRQLKRIIREEYSRLKRKSLIKENISGAPPGEYVIYSVGPDPVAFHIEAVNQSMMTAPGIQLVSDASEALQIVGDQDLVFWPGSHQGFENDPEDAWFIQTAVQAAVDEGIVNDRYYDELMDRFMEQAYDYSAEGY